MSVIENSIRMKIQTKGIPLEKWNIQINYGVKTGFNEAFIINGKTKDELIAEDPKSAEVIRPILRGRDIKKYSYSYADLWLISLFPSRHYNIDYYPAIKRHLLSFGMERLEQTGRVYSINGQNIRARKKTNNKWYETQDSISYWDDFSKQKIVYREISEEMDACIIDEEVYVNNKCYIITGEHLEYLICVLNSKLFNKIILQSANQTGGKGRDFLEKIHIPYRDNDMILVDLYRNLITTPSPDRFVLLKEIDAAVNKLYNLTKEEIDYIDNL
jgi:adenine-specific DNA-methyltransferase